MRKFGWILCGLVLAVAFAPGASAQNNQCDEPGEVPDIIIGDIFDKQRYGTTGGITGFAIGTESCNVGNCQANWISGTPNHPVIAQNMYRLKDGRFEQIGQSWLKHGFATLNNNLCGSCLPSDGQHLGVNCSDPYWAGLNGSQGSLGPRAEVNPKEGTHLHPYSFQGVTGNSIYKRMQVHNDDLDPAQNPGALYFVEAQYVAADDAAAGNAFNNNAWRPVNVTGSGSNFDFFLTGSTQREQQALYAWQANDPAVKVVSLDKQFIGASKATDLGGGLWNYEYAIENVLSDTAAGGFSIPIPHGVTITNVGFHDVDYHSGEPYDDKDWTVTIDTSSNPHTLVWSTDPHSVNPDANALRWGTAYNFRFDANIGPAEQRLSILPFNPAGSNVKWSTDAPDRCGDAYCDFDETPSACAADCADLGDAGEVPDGEDTPGSQLTVELEIGGDLTLDWDFSCVTGDADYEIYEGTIGDYSSHASKTCSTGGLTTATITPVSGGTYYLVVPNNGDREGSYGFATDGTPRPQGTPACMVQSIGTCD